MNTVNITNLAKTYSLISKCRENKNKQNGNKNNHTRVILIVVAIALAICFVASCSTSKGKMTFRNSQDALVSYQKFLQQLQGKENVPAEDLADLLNQWTELRDTIYNYIEKDSSFHKHNWLLTHADGISDSVKIELYRICSSTKRNIEDVLLIKERTALSIIDQNLESSADKARHFYRSLAVENTKNEKATQALNRYRTFLRTAKDRGIENEKELTDFLQEEDELFKSFLSHIQEYPDQDLSDITQMTEAVCMNICNNAAQKKMDSGEVVVYMAMRVNRRLLQNADTCLTCIEKKAKLSESQRMAFFWMIIQPFISIDRFGFTLLDDVQKKQLSSVAKRFIKAQSSEAFGNENPPTGQISDLILKLYISTL